MTITSPSRKVWPKEKVDQMCDLIADGLTMQAVSDRMGITRRAVVGQFYRIVQKMGAQAA